MNQYSLTFFFQELFMKTTLILHDIFNVKICHEVPVAIKKYTQINLVDLAIGKSKNITRI